MVERPPEGRRRVVIENVTPAVDGGRFAAKRIVGDEVEVQADAFTDGHDEIRVVLFWVGPLPADGSDPPNEAWQQVHMAPLGNDRWSASFPLAQIGRYRYTVSGWVDRFRTWRHDLAKRIDAGQDVRVDLLIGAELIEAAAGRARPRDAARLRSWAKELRAGKSGRALDESLGNMAERYPDRRFEHVHEITYDLVVDPERARYSSWYELFPRSASPDPARHGSLRDVEQRLDYVAELGFDVLYLPPIHPIGRQFRKGPNNQPSRDPDDSGVPWAIGAREGGHTAVHPNLGKLADFDRLVKSAAKRNIDIALDIAFQASPDHPWVKEHPSWFRARPDGTIQYAENPPKKYQDIYPFDFESEDWRGLWQALHDVFEFWIGHGVRIFRVDNPHTKSFAFWEWCIGALKQRHPEVLFLAEAFTRPKVMYRLAKLGFSQSYTYFTWRNEKTELTDYLRELTSPPVNDFFRPNFWTNTPDILHAVLQTGGRPAFVARLVLAATLTSNYGIYGPAYELMESTPREAGSEEYLDSEKYQQRTWNLDAPDSLRDLVATVNRARHEHPALQSNERLWFHTIDNEQLIAYSKNSADRSDIILTVVNLDFARPQAGMLHLPLDGLGLPTDGAFLLTDLLDGAVYRWSGSDNWIELDPALRAAHLFWVQRVPRTERQFEAYA